MSTIKVDTLDTRTGTGNITLNRPLVGDGSGLTSLSAANLTGTLPAISGASLTALPAGNLTGTVADARISTLTASKLTGALPAISGASLTGISGGKVLQVVAEKNGKYNHNTTSTTWQFLESKSSGVTWELAITPSSTSNYLLIMGVYGYQTDASGTQNRYRLSPYGKIGSGAYSQLLGDSFQLGRYILGNTHSTNQMDGLHPFHLKYSPATTSEVKIKLGFRVMYAGNGCTITLNPHAGDETRMTVMEIEG